MAKLDREMLRVVPSRPHISGVRVGKIVEWSARGPVLVDFPGNPFGPVESRVTASVSRASLRKAFQAGQSVLLAFEERDPGQPILFDVVMIRPGRGKRPGKTSQPEKAEAIATTGPSGACVGRIVAVQEGTVLVDYPGNPDDPRPARSSVALRNLKDEVMLQILPGNQPVIVGQLFATVPVEPTACEQGELKLKAARIHLEAETEIVLVAGTTRIHLDAAGKAVTTADQVVSRARGANKVQGGCIQLN